MNSIPLQIDQIGHTTEFLHPTGCAFSTQAVLAVLLSSEPGSNPTRLTVKFPVTDLERVRRTLAELALEWQLDEAEIDAWEADGQAERLLLDWTGLRCQHGRATEGVAYGRPRVRSRPWRRLSPRPDGEGRERRRSQLVLDGRRALSCTRERDRQD
jgi:hypothetical protein